jgi:Kef-type K+ transport system membrane component KefB
MADDFFLRSLGLITMAGAVFSVAAGWIRMPTIVAYMIAGLVIGPLTGLVEISHALELISEIGIALLLFIVGLELSLDKVRDVGKVAVVAGIGQVVFTAVIGYALCLLLGFSWIEAAFLATALTFSSTVVVVKLLDEKHEMDTLYGRIAVGIFLVQDLVAIVMLTFLAGLGTGSVDPSTAALSMVKAFAGVAGLLALVLVAARWLLPGPFAWAARTPETNVIWSLTWCFLIVLAAELFGLSLEIGAFLAGLSLAQLPYNNDLRRRVHPLMNFFIAVFFVSLGVKMELSAAFDNAGTVALLSLFVIIGNPVIFIWIILRMGYGQRTSFFTAVTVAQISEFSFILVAMGVRSGLIEPSILSITALVGLVTITVSAYMILYNEKLYRLVKGTNLLAFFGRPAVEDKPPEPHRLRDHFIVVGINSLGRELVKLLRARGESVLAIDTDPRKLSGLGCDTLLGDAGDPTVLVEAGLPSARMLVSALTIEETNDLLAYRCREAGIPCAVNVMDLSATENLLAMDVCFMLVPKVDGVSAQDAELRKLGVLPS